jgi:Fe-S-cluster containining protein
MNLKSTNEVLKASSQEAIEAGGNPYACGNCTSSHCCTQKEVGIAPIEFDWIESLVTDIHIERARRQVKLLEVDKDRVMYVCPFLSPNGCDIYDNRFAVCATYSVLGTDGSQCRHSGIETIAMVRKDKVLTIAMKDEIVEDRVLQIYNSGVDNGPSDVLEEFKRRYKI